MSATRAIALATLFVGAICGLTMMVSHNIMPGFRDTDDAMRLVMVRSLVDGRGWYDQAIWRLDPPHGLWMHWSRLIDGGVAGMILTFRQFMSAANAEYWARSLWPLIWVFPMTAGALALARNLGGRSAVFLAAVVMLINPNAYRQFVPGRIDHHDIQIVAAVVAMACATARRRRTPWAAVGGAATALGLAIGLEALLLQALIAGSYGVALMRDSKARAPAMAYGVALAVTTLALFMIQTPPWRWAMSFCDALAFNLTAAIAVGGAGLALAAWAAPRVGAATRVGLVVACGAAAIAVYLAIDPRCLRGPFEAMNPAVRSFWFDRVQEVQPLDRMMRIQQGPAMAAAVLLVLSLISAIYLVVRRWRDWDHGALLILAGIILSSIIAWFAWRMQDYVYGLGLPAFAAALSWFGQRRWRDLWIPGVLAALVLSPSVSGAVVTGAVNALTPKRGRGYVNAGPRCFAASAYRPLAAMPAGDVLAPQDLGPFILVYTHHSAVAAPYHRMSNVILAVHEVWNAPAARAEAEVRALGADYVVDCPPYPLMANPKGFGPALRAGRIPPWLVKRSAPKATLQIYQVLPPRGRG